MSSICLYLHINFLSKITKHDTRTHVIPSKTSMSSHNPACPTLLPEQKHFAMAPPTWAQLLGRMA